MLLSEMVRKITKEEVLHRDTTSYTSPTAHDWATRKTKTITLSEPTLVFVRFTARTTGSNAMGSVRLLHNSVPVLVYQHLPLGSDTPHSLLMLLPAGNHTFDLQTAVDWSPNGNEVAVVKEFYIAALGFADQAGQEYAPSIVSVPAGGTATVLSLSFSVPSARKLAVGKTKQYACIVTVYAEMPDYRGSALKNPGETDDATMNFKIYLDGAQLSWKERINDNFDLSYNRSYSEGCHGRVYFPLDVGTSHTLKIDAKNTDTVARNVRAVVNIVLSPWLLLDSDFEPLSLDFPQGSTLYVVLEPAYIDPTKNLKIGWKRFVSFGDATDYYYTASGTGVVSASYTFESVEVGSCRLLVNGYGGCISIVGVDVR